LKNYVVGPARKRFYLHGVVSIFLLALVTLRGVCEPRTAEPDRGIAGKKAAEKALLQGRIDEAVGMLQQVIAASPTDAQARLLLCRAFYAEDETEEAIGACEKAVKLSPGSSEAQDRLGRAYGEKADHSGPLDGYKLARKVRVAFEAAVKADALNGAAVNDLSEYYIAAPAIVGGGLDRATALASRSAGRLPQQAHRIEALAAEKRKDYGAAEREFLAAVDVARRPDAWADLGGYYARRKQTDLAVDALKHCLAADKAKDAAIVDAASILNGMHVEARLARLTLEQYLAGNGKSDDAPVAKVHVLLGKMLSEAGDAAAARVEYGKALELAANYAPAKRALEQK
jgi:tetratricopeptide (TPR) repeat protein